MPYPRPDDPRYCPGSDQPAASYDPKAIWHRCPACGRAIGARRDTRLWPHIETLNSGGERVKESLIAGGHNVAVPRGPMIYADDPQ